MSFLNCQFKWSFPFQVSIGENSFCKVLTPERLEIHSIIVGTDKDLNMLQSTWTVVNIKECSTSNVVANKVP